jgi:two-component system, response regulator, stage 0 sporulation protein A
LNRLTITILIILMLKLKGWLKKMIQEISVLLADDNIEFGNLLSKYLSQQEDIRIVGVARDGVEAYDMIIELMPDVVVLDIIMPNLDGIGVLEKLSSIELKRRPLFIVLTAIGQDIFIQKAITLGAEYYIVKPFDINVLVSRIRQIYNDEKVSSFSHNKVLTKVSAENVKQPNQSFNLEVEVTNMMHEIGIPPHMSGYQYIREAIMMTVNNSKIFSSITRVLYPAVAEKYSSSSQKVERAIRNAIESAWERGHPDSIDTLFGYTVNNSKGKPTNSEFIAMIADKVRINMEQSKS